MADASRLWRDVRRLRGSLRTNLFVVPLLFTLGSVVMAEGLLHVDRRGWLSGVPGLETSWTVESARAMLTTVASATMTVAGIAFSVSLLTVQLAASEYSPRVVHGIFRDPFNRRVVGVVVGAFTYDLLVLRSVRDVADGDPLLPSTSLLVALVMGIVAILAVVAFIHHNAHAVEVSELLARVSGIDLDLERDGDGSAEGGAPRELRAIDPFDWPDGAGSAVQARREGWVLSIDEASIVAALPERASARLSVSRGSYVLAGTPLCALRAVDGRTGLDDLHETVCGAVQIGPTMARDRDPAFVIRQLVDVALRALSPGINDPTTAREAIFRLAGVLAHILRAPSQPVALEGHGGRRLLRGEPRSDAGYIDAAFDEVRRDAAERPVVCASLLEAISLVRVTVGTALRPEADEALRVHAIKILDSARKATDRSDLDAVVSAFRQASGMEVDAS